MPDEGIVLREAADADADAVAALHAASWQAAYRGMMSDAYLDGPVAGERRLFWRERLRSPRAGLWTLLAEQDGALAGFLCLLADHDHHWGSLIDNIHVASALARQGLGRRMMRVAGEHLVYALPRRPVYLFVLDANEAARGFYDRLGGEPAERLVSTEPDGSQLPVTRYVWPSATAFAEAIG